MALDRRTVLAAIAAETADRSGPMPVWLVEVAANAKTKPERDFVATELIALRQEQLIECHRQNGASGISLTEAGRAELRALNQGKPSPAASRPAPTPAAPVPPGAPPVSEVVSESAPPAPPGDALLPVAEILDPIDQPRLYALVMALSRVTMSELEAAIETRDLARARELQALLDGVRRHLGRPS
ncbi:hypothetical protein [Halomonas sp. JS92-SW72]|uniref:hypothetical protein n=1 Tax=Halomonas sp. JS92-SW72 TaxID=2306583 RepID=UPI0013C31315|nr:hypothetical protein [Halomonas sp. JS92-SW72]